MGRQQAKEFMRGTAGLNTRLDPERIQQGGRDTDYTIELARAVNISIDDKGLTSLRGGYSSLQSGEFHSLYCNGGDCFVVQERTSDAIIARVVSVSPVVLETVKTGLSVDRRTEFCQINTDTFWSNGAQNGYIRGGVNYNWRVGTYRGPDANLQFETSVPVANHIAFRPGGQMILAEGAAVWTNHEPFQFGLYNKRSGYIGFQSDVLMLAMVNDGFFASDCERTWFFRKMPDNWYLYRQELAYEYPAIEWSLAHDKVLLRDCGIDSPGFGRIWCSTNGICVGTDQGLVVNLTEEKVLYPNGYSSGASLIKDKTVINTAQ